MIGLVAVLSSLTTAGVMNAKKGKNRGGDMGNQLDELVKETEVRRRATLALRRSYGGYFLVTNPVSSPKRSAIHRAIPPSTCPSLWRVGCF